MRCLRDMPRSAFAIAAFVVVLSGYVSAQESYSGNRRSPNTASRVRVIESKPATPENQHVTIVGAVRESGVYKLETPTISVAALIEAAGGVTADSTSVRIVRKERPLYQFLNHPDIQEVTQAGDVVVVVQTVRRSAAAEQGPHAPLVPVAVFGLQPHVVVLPLAPGIATVELLTQRLMQRPEVAAAAYVLDPYGRLNQSTLVPGSIVYYDPQKLDQVELERVRLLSPFPPMKTIGGAKDARTTFQQYQLPVERVAQALPPDPYGTSTPMREAPTPSFQQSVPADEQMPTPIFEAPTSTITIEPETDLALPPLGLEPELAPRTSELEVPSAVTQGKLPAEATHATYGETAEPRTSPMETVVWQQPVANLQVQETGKLTPPVANLQVQETGRQAQPVDATQGQPFPTEATLGTDQPHLPPLLPLVTEPMPQRQMAEVTAGSPPPVISPRAHASGVNTRTSEPEPTLAEPVFTRTNLEPTPVQSSFSASEPQPTLAEPTLAEPTLAEPTPAVPILALQDKPLRVTEQRSAPTPVIQDDTLNGEEIASLLGEQQSKSKSNTWFIITGILATLALAGLAGAIVWSRMEADAIIQVSHETGPAAGSPTNEPTTDPLAELLDHQVPVIEEQVLLPEDAPIHGQTIGHRRIMIHAGTDEVAGPHFARQAQRTMRPKESVRAAEQKLRDTLREALATGSEAGEVSTDAEAERLATANPRATSIEASVVQKAPERNTGRTEADLPPEYDVIQPAGRADGPLDRALRALAKEQKS